MGRAAYPSFSQHLLNSAKRLVLTRACFRPHPTVFAGYSDPYEDYARAFVSATAHAQADVAQPHRHLQFALLVIGIVCVAIGTEVYAVLK